MNPLEIDEIISVLIKNCRFESIVTLREISKQYHSVVDHHLQYLASKFHLGSPLTIMGLIWRHSQQFHSSILRTLDIKIRNAIESGDLTWANITLNKYGINRNIYIKDIIVRTDNIDQITDEFGPIEKLHVKLKIELISLAFQYRSYQILKKLLTVTQCGSQLINIIKSHLSLPIIEILYEVYPDLLIPIDGEDILSSIAKKDLELIQWMILKIKITNLDHIWERILSGCIKYDQPEIFELLNNKCCTKNIRSNVKNLSYRYIESSVENKSWRMVKWLLIHSSGNWKHVLLKSKTVNGNNSIYPLLKLVPNLPSVEVAKIAADNNIFIDWNRSQLVSMGLLSPNQETLLWTEELIKQSPELIPNLQSYANYVMTKSLERDLVEIVIIKYQILSRLTNFTITDCRKIFELNYMKVRDIEVKYWLSLE